MFVDNGEIVVDTPYGISDTCGIIEGAYFDKRRGVWKMPLGLKQIKTLAQTMELSDDVRAAGIKLVEEGRQRARIKSTEYRGGTSMPVTVDPWPHQVKAYDMALATFSKGYGGYGLLFDLGTGKTITAVGIMGRMYLDKKIDRVLVAAPSSVLPEWSKTLDRFAKFPNAWSICTGDKRQRERSIDALSKCSGLKVAIINYESAWRTDEAILKFAPQLIVADESQRIKCHTAKQSKFMHKLAEKAPYRMILSGTPLQNSPLDFFSQYLFLDKSVFGTKWYGFKGRYAVQQTGFNRATGREFKQVVAYRNLDELTERVHSIALRVENGVIDLPPELPPITRYAVLSRDERRVYDSIKEDSIAELEGGGVVTAQNALSKILRLQQVTSGFIVNEDGELSNVAEKSAKVELFSEVVDDVVVEQGEKMVVFFRFIHDLENIEAVLKAKGIGYVSLYGGTKQGDRAAAVKAFSEDPSVKVFVGQIAASGTGIDGLQDQCHTACFYSLGYNYAEYFQAKGRINRNGQEKSCVYVHLVCEGTVDELVLKSMEEKKNLADMIVGSEAANMLM